MSTSPEPIGPGAAPAPVPDGRYVIDPARSTVRFRAKAFGLLWVNGRMPVVAGDIEVVDGRWQGSGEIAADEVDTGIGARDWHLRSGHYLRTADHPRIQVALDPVHTSETAPTVAVTVRGRRHPVTMEVRTLDRDGAGLRLRLATALDRSPYPMLPPLAGVSRVVHLEVDLAAAPQ